MLPDVPALETLHRFEPTPFKCSSNSQIYKSLDGKTVYKFHGTQHELDMMLAAGDCSVRPCERVVWMETDGALQVTGFTMIRETPLEAITASPNQRRTLMNGMISCVLTLHQRGIVHGDIKPANMLLCSDGQIRLCDFAEARKLDEDPADWDGSVTTNYVSPYRCHGWPNSRDPPPVIQDDLYALGLSIWELYVGKIPFDDVYDDDIRDALKAGQTVDVREVTDEAIRAVIIGYLRYGGARV